MVSLNREKINKTFYKTEQAVENQIDITYEPYKLDENDFTIVDCLVTFNSDIGIEYVKYPDQSTVYCNGKNTLAIDYTSVLYEDYVFKVKQVGQAEKNVTLTVNDLGPLNPAIFQRNS